MNFFTKSMPLRRKLVVIIMSICSLLLFLNIILFAVSIITSYRSDNISFLDGIAKTTSISIAPGLIFNDRESAREVLNTLKGSPDILNAAVTRPDGQLFAQYTKSYDSTLQNSDFLEFISNNRETACHNEIFHFFSLKPPYYLHFCRPIIYSNDNLGNIYLSSSLEQLWGQIAIQLWLALLVLLIMFALVFFLSKTVANTFTSPILNLLSTMKRVTSSSDYSIRCSKLNQDEVGDLTDGFNQMISVIQSTQEKLKAETNERIQLSRQLQQAQKMEALGSLTGGIAHDFNNTLTSIIGFTNLALNPKACNSPEKLESYLTQVKIAGERSKELVNQMLEFSRGIISSGMAPAKLEIVIEESMKLIRPMLPASIEIEMDIRETSPVSINYVQVQQIIMNLCINARDAMAGKGKIMLRAETINNYAFICSSCHRKVKGDYTCLTVIDSGPGISIDIKDRIFEPFFSTKGRGKGTGMGLAIMHGNIHSAHGHIIVESNVDSGSAFTILLPVFHEEIIHSNVEANAESHLIHGEGKRVLIIDDEEQVASFIKTALEIYGFDSTVKYDSRAAWELLKRDPYQFDLIITDQTMPKMTGDELAGKVLSLNPGVPIILCTGYSDVIDEKSAINMGIRSFITKPIDMPYLLNTISEILITETI